MVVLRRGTVKLKAFERLVRCSRIWSEACNLRSIQLNEGGATKAPPHWKYCILRQSLSCRSYLKALIVVINATDKPLLWTIIPS